MVEKENYYLYENQIKSIIVTLDYICSVWNSIKDVDLEEIKTNWIGKDCEIFIGKFLENEKYFDNLENILEDFKHLYNKIYDI